MLNKEQQLKISVRRLKVGLCNMLQVLTKRCALQLVFFGSLMVLGLIGLFITFSLGDQAPTDIEAPRLLNGTSSRSATSSGTDFAYFFGWGGEFLKVDLHGQSIVSSGTLVEAEGAAPLLPPYSKGALTAHTAWLPRGLQYDRNKGRLYGVFPKKDANEATELLIAFQLPTMEVVRAIDLPRTVAGTPRILVSPDGEKLFVSYRDTATEEKASSDITVSVIDVYDAARFDKIQTIREITDTDDYLSARTRIHASFFTNAYFSSDGKTIYDNLDRIHLDDSGNMTKERINPLETLSDSQRLKLVPFEKVDPLSGKPWLKYGTADSAAGRVLLMVSDRERPGGALWSVDLDTWQSSPIIEISSPITSLTTHLTPTGEHIILEEIEWRIEKSAYEREPDRESSYKTGAFSIYNPVSGYHIQRLELGELAGFRSRLVCISPKGDLVFYSAGDNLYVVSLTEGTARKLDSDFSVDQWTECVFTDR